MESRVKILGHPVHPILIVLPLGLLIMAVVFDVLHSSVGMRRFRSWRTGTSWAA